MLLHNKQQKAIEEILNSFDGDMVLVLKEIERLLNRYMLTKSMSTTNALKFDIEFNRILQESGYYNLVNKMIDTDYDEMFTLISEGFAAGGLVTAYTAEDLSRVMALKALQVDRFSLIGTTAGTTLKESLFKYALSNYTVEDMQAQILKDFQGTTLAKHSKTLANTSIKEFQESMIDIGAEGLNGVWVYIGVRDSINRDFCRCVLDKNQYYGDEEKNKLKDDEDRRFNCRHRFRMVTEEYAIKSGFKKSTRTSC